MSGSLLLLDDGLPALVDRATQALAAARTSAEVLEAREMAAFVYDAAKRSARLAKAKGAHDTLIAAAHRAQADALEIEAAAKRRLADEYDAAQERGEVSGRGGERSGREHSPAPATAADLGLTRKDIHEARQIRDAEVADPGVVKRALETKLAAKEEPTRTALRQAVVETVTKGWRPPPSTSTAPKHVQEKNPAWDRFLSVKDACRTLSDILGEYGPEALLAGALDDASIARASVVIRSGHSQLTKLVEALDA